MDLNCLLKRFSNWVIKANITLKFGLDKTPLVDTKVKGRKFGKAQNFGMISKCLLSFFILEL